MRTLSLPEPNAQTLILPGRRPSRTRSVPLRGPMVDEGELGHGGMASVRQVFDPALHRRVAKKVLAARAKATDEARFWEEAQITGQLEHPNIPPVHDLGVDATGCYFTMKRIHGQTLDSLLRAGAFPSGDDTALFRALQIFLKVCDAISYAHSRGVVHCDLKPSNVMVGSHGQVYVVDWGIARVLSRGDDGVHLTTPPLRPDGQVEGTPAYMSPEQACGDTAAIDERTDVFGLGAILYRILSGRAPFSGTSAEDTWSQSKRGAVAPIEAPAPAQLVELTMRALAQRAERIPSVEALQAELEAYLRRSGQQPRHVFEAGALILREGDPGDAAYVIESGQVQVFRGEGEGRTVLCAMGPGEIFGEAAVFSGASRTASVEALTEVEVVVVTRESLDEEMGQTRWAGAFVRRLAERFGKVDAREVATARRAESAELEAEVLRHAAFAGMSTSQRCREAPWTPLAQALAREKGWSGAEAASRVSALTGVSLDKGRDVISVSI